MTRRVSGVALGWPRMAMQPRHGAAYLDDNRWDVRQGGAREERSRGSGDSERLHYGYLRIGNGWLGWAGL